MMQGQLLIGAGENLRRAGEIATSVSGDTMLVNIEEKDTREKSSQNKNKGEMGAAMEPTEDEEDEEKAFL